MSAEAANLPCPSNSPAEQDERDRADMIRLTGGHDAALNELMHRHGGNLFGYLTRSLQNYEEAADVAQEVFVRVYQNRRSFKTSQRSSTWLYAIATNLVKDRFRYRSRHPNVLLDRANETTGATFRDTLPGENPSPSEGQW